MLENQRLQVTFYVYEDEVLAKKHVNPTIFSRLEKTKAKQAEAAAQEAPATEEKEGSSEKTDPSDETKEEEKSE